MMKSTYMVGGRLMVQNTAKEANAPTSVFYDIYPEVAVREEPIYDAQVDDGEFDADAFNDIDWQDGDSGTFIKYFHGNLGWEEVER